MPEQLHGVGGVPGTRDDVRDDRLAGTRMRFADHRDILDVAVTAQRVFDLAGEHVEARHDDDVLGPVDERQPTVGVGDRDVAGVQPTVDEHGVRRGGVVPVAREDVGAAHDELAGIAFERGLAVAVEESHLDARAAAGRWNRAAVRSRPRWS